MKAKDKKKQEVTPKKKIIGVRFLIGLPGAGKSTFAKEYAKTTKNVTIIDFDNTYETFSNTYEVFPILEVFNQQLKYKEGYYKTYMPFEDMYVDYKTKDLFLFDGLFLDNSSIINTYLMFCRYLSKNSFYNRDNTEIRLAFDYWEPDIDACLANDPLRIDRKYDSSSIIKNAKLKYPDIENIKKVINDSAVTNNEVIPINDKISEFKHNTIVATIYEKVFEPNIKYEKDGKKYLKSECWTIGGRWGDYMGNSGDVTPDETPEFDEYDEMLRIICPNITYLDYKDIRKKCVTTEETTEYGYYGGYTKYKYFLCDLDILYDELKKAGYIIETMKTNK